MSTSPHREQSSASARPASPDPSARNFQRRPNPAKKGIWFLGSATLGVGIIDRSVATLMDGVLSWFEVLQIFITLFFFCCWLLLKPSQRGGGL